MKIIPRVALLFLCAGLTLLAVQTADARTPTPTSTATPTATATSRATATPSPQQLARFHGEEWVDAQIAGDTITAKIGDVVCGTGGPIPMADVPITYQIDVVSEEIKPGCGREGAHLTFLIGDRQATQMATWHSGGDTALNLIAGPPFALFAGNTSLRCDERFERQILPFIGDVVCGQGKRNEILAPPCTGQLVGYTDIVFSAQQKPGCGVEGSQITFKLLDLQGNVVAIAKEKGTWHAWDGVSDPQQLNLTFTAGGGIKMPSTGTGDAYCNEGSWGRTAILLGFVGLTGAALGFALRRRAMRR